MPGFPFTEVKSVRRWTNFSGSLPEQAVPEYCTPDVPGHTGADVPRKLRRTGQALTAILEHCFQVGGPTLRAVGSRWSFSTIVKPGRLLVDPANLNMMASVNRNWLTPAYRATRAAFTPVFVQGGTEVASINRRLLSQQLALQTSGAGDGHRMAGCIATGTHGSALDVGAVHDTILGVHLLTRPGHSVLIQGSQPACDDNVRLWLERETGVTVEAINDDTLFATTRVSLGSLGFVHAVIVEAEPLYALEGRVLNHRFDDPALWQTLSDLDTQRLHPDRAERPFHFEAVFHPYPRSGRPGAFVKLFWKVPGDAAPPVSPGPVAPGVASDVMGVLAHLTEVMDGPLTGLALRLFIAEELERRYRPGHRPAQVPGMVWGPSALPPGHGASTEVVVDHRHTRQALEHLFGVLDAEASQGRHLLGAVSVRFVPKGRADLGMNIHPMNCFIELPSIRNDEVLGIYRAFWDALEAAQIPFTCHWGQLGGMTPTRLVRYFGDRVGAWKAGRDRLLDATGKRVFSSPLLVDVGLD